MPCKALAHFKQVVLIPEVVCFPKSVKKISSKRLNVELKCVYVQVTTSLKA
jgi:hypothetical protein